MRRFLVATLVALAGCPAPDNSHGLVTTAPPAQLLDYNEFVCEVQPVLIRHCSFLGCHGNAEHALRVYSAGKLRLDEGAGTRAIRDAKLSADEVMRNFESATGTVYFAQPGDRQSPNDKVPILSKPARASVGGAEHHGVGIFPVYPAQDPPARQFRQQPVHGFIQAQQALCGQRHGGRRGHRFG